MKSRDRTGNGMHNGMRQGSWRRTAMASAVSAVILAGLSYPTLAADAADQSYKQHKDQSAKQDAKEDKGLLTGAMRTRLPEGVYKASDLIGANLKDSKGGEIAEIKDLALNPTDKSVQYVVVAHGGVLGVGDKLYAVPTDKIQQGKDHNEFILDMTDADFKNMQAFGDDRWPADASVKASAGADKRDMSQTAAAGGIVKGKEYLDREVKNSKGDDLGEIEDLAIDLSSGQIKYAVIEHGGVLGIGEKLVAVPTSSLTLGVEENHLVLNVSEQEIKNAKGFADDNWPIAANSLSDVEFDESQSTMARTKRDMSDKSSMGKQSFNDLDADNDGYLSRSEVNDMPKLDQRYDSLDQNNDGQLDKAEFARFEVKIEGDIDRDSSR